MSRDRSNGLTPSERRTTMSLAGIFALRMLGLFLVLPVFALYAQHLEGATPALIGFALGAYGLTQAMFQVAFGMASDRFGRKPVITFGMILFCLGSLVCAQADTIDGMIWGRILQGSGAVAAAITAMIADLTREEVRTKAMAMLGGGIALSFAVSLVAGPIMGAAWGVDVIFYIVAGLSALSIVLLWLVVPTPPVTRHHRDMEVTTSDLKTVLAHGDLRRLDFGVFVLHMSLTAIFVSVPMLLVNYIPAAALWKVYLPVILISFAIMVPTTIIAEVKGKITLVLRLGIVCVAASAVVLMLGAESKWGVITGLTVFFIGFNMLEPILPSMVTKFSPAGARGTGSGVFNTFQFLGPFVGGTVGGLLMHHSPQALFVFILVAALAWLAVTVGMSTPVPYRQVVVPLPEVDPSLYGKLVVALSALEGVGDVKVFEDDREAHVRFISKEVTVEAIYETAQQATASAPA